MHHYAGFLQIGSQISMMFYSLLIENSLGVLMKFGILEVPLKFLIDVHRQNDQWYLLQSVLYCFTVP